MMWYVLIAYIFLSEITVPPQTYTRLWDPPSQRTSHRSPSPPYQLAGKVGQEWHGPLSSEQACRNSLNLVLQSKGKKHDTASQLLKGYATETGVVVD